MRRILKEGWGDNVKVSSSINKLKYGGEIRGLLVDKVYNLIKGSGVIEGVEINFLEGNNLDLVYRLRDSFRTSIAKKVARYIEKMGLRGKVIVGPSKQGNYYLVGIYIPEDIFRGYKEGIESEIEDDMEGLLRVKKAVYNKDSELGILRYECLVLKKVLENKAIKDAMKRFGYELILGEDITKAEVREYSDDDPFKDLERYKRGRTEFQDWEDKILKELPKDDFFYDLKKYRGINYKKREAERIAAEREWIKKNLPEDDPFYGLYDYIDKRNR